MFSTRETFSASPSISRLLSTSCVWTPKLLSSNRIFSSRVPKRFSTPRLIRTLVFIDGVFDASDSKKTGQDWNRGDYRESNYRQPASAGGSRPSLSIILL